MLLWQKVDQSQRREEEYPQAKKICYFFLARNGKKVLESLTYVFIAFISANSRSANKSRRSQLRLGVVLW
jgi:hypothetical protein